MTRRRRVLFLGLSLLAAAIVVVVYLFDWNLLKPYIERRIASETGRSFAINGDLNVELGRVSTISAERIVLGNASWSQRPEMARLKRLEFQVRLWPLIHRRVEIPHARLDEPWLLVEQNDQGKVNWQFDRGRKKEPSSAENSVRFGRIDVRGGEIEAELPGEKTSFRARFAGTQGATDSEGRIETQGTGRFRDLPFELSGSGGAVFGLREKETPYPVSLRGRIGDTRFTAEGTVKDVRGFGGMAIRFTLAGKSMAELYPILRMPLPPTPAYQLSGRLEHEASEWRFSGFQGKVGSSDLAGDWAVDVGREPRYIKATLNSRQLDMKDLSGMIGARKESGAPARPKGGKVLPQSPFNLEKLRVADADVHFRGERIINERLPIDNLDVRLQLRSGRLTLDPLVMGVADGKVRATVQMDTARTPFHTEAQVAAERLRLTRLVPALGENKRVNTGLVGGRAALSMDGNSTAQMLATADGDAAFIMSGGEISKLLLRLANLDVANLVPILLAGDKPVPVRCMVAQLRSTEGRAKVSSFVLDTQKQLVEGSGEANFGSETLDLRLDVHPKDISLAALRGPIVIQGSFAKPSVRPEIVQPGIRAAAAVALAFVTPPLALLPLVELGGAEDAPCGQLIRQANRGELPREKKMNRTSTPVPPALPKAHAANR